MPTNRLGVTFNCITCGHARSWGIRRHDRKDMQRSLGFCALSAACPIAHLLQTRWNCAHAGCPLECATWRVRKTLRSVHEAARLASRAGEPPQVLPRCGAREACGARYISWSSALMTLPMNLTRLHKNMFRNLRRHPRSKIFHPGTQPNGGERSDMVTSFISGMLDA